MDFSCLLYAYKCWLHFIAFLNFLHLHVISIGIVDFQSRWLSSQVQPDQKNIIVVVEDLILHFSGFHAPKSNTLNIWMNDENTCPTNVDQVIQLYMLDQYYHQATDNQSNLSIQETPEAYSFIHSTQLNNGQWCKKGENSIYSGQQICCTTRNH